MKRIILISVAILVFGSSIFAQKTTEPILLGGLVSGEDPSEFLLHRVMETSNYYLKDYPNGKLIGRICGADDFSTAFVKSVFNPLSASRYNFFTKSIIVPYEKIFIAKSSKCSNKQAVVFTEYWFVPDKKTLEFDEIYAVNDISDKVFFVDDYDFEKNKAIKTEAEEKQFAENIDEFIKELKNNPKAEGFIVHNSKNKWMKRNIEKVLNIAGRENIGLKRVKTVVKVRLEMDKNDKLFPVKDEKRYFPRLEVLAVNK